MEDEIIAVNARVKVVGDKLLKSMDTGRYYISVYPTDLIYGKIYFCNLIYFGNNLYLIHRWVEAE